MAGNYLKLLLPKVLKSHFYKVIFLNNNLLHTKLFIPLLFVYGFLPNSTGPVLFLCGWNHKQYRKVFRGTKMLFFQTKKEGFLRHRNLNGQHHMNLRTFFWGTNFKAG